jgi:NADH-quinone oxidoreductase subunit E
MSPRPAPKPLKKYVYAGDPLADPPPPGLIEILDRYRGRPDALITVLEEIQDHYSFLPQRHLEYTARELGFPLSQIYGIATFYNLFKLNPPGRYQVRICKGTACHVSQSAAILDLLIEKLGIGEDETTEDGLITLQTLACVGACSLAPVVVVNDRTYGRMTPEKAWEVLRRLREDIFVPDEGVS